MSTRLVILGLLRRGPLHGYEIKHIIEESMGDWTSIAFGSIYFALGKLADEGFVAKVATEQEGNRPSRTVYEITAEGRAEFMRLLRDIWGDLERQYFAIDIGISFMDALPKDEVEGYLRARAGRLEGILSHLEAHRDEEMGGPHVPASARAVFEHNLAHFRAELEWTRAFLADFRAGAYD